SPPPTRPFRQCGGRGTCFPRPAAAAVPAEAAIAFGLTGPYEILIGGAPATLGAIAGAAALLEAHACDQAIVLAVEVFAECADVFARVRRAPRVPLVETAACLWLDRGHGTIIFERRRGGTGGDRARIGEMLSCEPLATLALARETGGEGPVAVAGARRGETARLEGSAGPYRTRSRGA